MSKFSILQILIADRDIINNILDFDSEWQDNKKNIIQEINKNDLRAKLLYEIRNPNDDLTIDTVFYLQFIEALQEKNDKMIPTLDSRNWRNYISAADNISIVYRDGVNVYTNIMAQYPLLDDNFAGGINSFTQFAYKKEIIYKYLNLPATPNQSKL